MMSSQEVSAKTHIAQLFNEKALNDRNSSTLTSALESTIDTSFKGEHKFIFELLQNADDAALEAAPVDVTFAYASLLNKDPDSQDSTYLLFFHSGKPFSKQDVEKITDYAYSQESDKSKEQNKTGYKGIGFKAVFSISDHIQIHSGDYHFRFDKHYPQWQVVSKDKRFPWPIIPIWTESHEIPEILKDQLNSQQVNFIIKVKKQINLREELKFIIQNPNIMLFLRNVRSITIRDDQAITKLTLKRLDNEIYQLYRDKKLINQWTVQCYTIKINESVQHSLQSMSEYECPARLKSAKQTTIMFAAELDEKGELQKTKNALLYTYLPTQAKCGFPFLVNSDFLLNADRTRLTENDWNNYLIHRIGYLQFEWFSKLAAQSQFRRHFLRLLTLDANSNLSAELERHYQLGYEKGIKTVKFIPAHNEERLLSINEVIFDETEFYRYMQLKPPLPSGTLADYQLQETLILKNRKEASRIVLEQLCQFLPKHVIANKTVVFQLEILNYIFDVLQPNIEKTSLNRDRWRELLKKTPFLLTDDEEVAAPEGLYIEAADAKAECPADFKVNFVHCELLQLHNAKERLGLIGVREASSIEFIRGHIMQLIQANGITISNIIPIMQYIFNAFVSNQVLEGDWLLLCRMPVLTTKNRIASPESFLYLSDHYKPTLCLESCLENEDIFVSPLYLRENFAPASVDLKLQWRKFFSKLGIRGSIKFFCREQYGVGEAKRDKPFRMESYLSELRIKGIISIKIREKHCFINFPDCNLLPYINNPAFSKIFWQEVIKNWDSIKQFSPPHYASGVQSKPLSLSYLQYIIRREKCVPSTKMTLCKPTEIYSTNLSHLSDIFPVVDIGVELSLEQAEYFGFKTKLQFSDCLKLLQLYNEKKCVDVNQYEFVLRFLLELKLSDSEKNQIKKIKLELPAQNGTLQPTTQLRCFAIEKEKAPAKSNRWLREFPKISRKDLISLSQLFNIIVVDDTMVKLVTEPDAAQLKPDYDLRQVINQRLPVIARIEQQANATDEKRILITLSQKIARLRFYNANRLRQIFADEQDTDFAVFAFLSKSGQFFYRDPWKSTRTLRQFCEKLSQYLELSTQSCRLLETILTEKDYLEIVAEEFDLSHLLESSNELDTLENSLARSCQITQPAIEKDEKNDTAKITKSLIQKQTLKDAASSLKPTEQKAMLSDSMARTLSKSARSSMTVNEASKNNHENKPDKLINVDSLDLDTVPMRSAFLTPKNDLTKKSISRSAINTSATPLPDSFKLAASNKSSTESDIQSIVGRSGEELVFRRLKCHYQEKYQNCIFEDTEKGFRCEGLDLQNRPIKLEVIWHNIQGESGQPKDITIIKNGRQRIIEVKSTTQSKNQSNMFVSENELAMMRECKDRYRIFLVCNMGTSTPSIEKIKDPAKKLQEGSLRTVRMEISFSN